MGYLQQRATSGNRVLGIVALEKFAGWSPVGHLGFADYYLVRVAEPYDPALVVTKRLPRTFPANV
jgi:hypothetical protein